MAAAAPTVAAALLSSPRPEPEVKTEPVATVARKSVVLRSPEKR
jgi:hypothetical protein